eukprot:TRINITY_DN567_c0_g1_i1.p1 TRINITY_DN567_c0_g1~~TRINITY_DN567_c0_g1_i1.p1  ORF type:complete len:311 (+),score=37.14 TRINITY_DN567_c0_g1_i1:57-989(+)
MMIPILNRTRSIYLIVAVLVATATAAATATATATATAAVLVASDMMSPVTAMFRFQHHRDLAAQLIGSDDDQLENLRSCRHILSKLHRFPEPELEDACQGYLPKFACRSAGLELLQKKSKPGKDDRSWQPPSVTAACRTLISAWSARPRTELLLLARQSSRSKNLGKANAKQTLDWAVMDKLKSKFTDLTGGALVHQASEPGPPYPNTSSEAAITFSNGTRLDKNMENEDSVPGMSFTSSTPAPNISINSTLNESNNSTLNESNSSESENSSSSEQASEDQGQNTANSTNSTNTTAAGAPVRVKGVEGFS